MPDSSIQWAETEVAELASGVILSGIPDLASAFFRSWISPLLVAEHSSIEENRLLHLTGTEYGRPGLILAFLSPTRFGDTLRDAWNPKLRRQG
jgi:hypothetical protein